MKNGIQYSTMREITLLKSLRTYPQFVRILDVIKDEKSEEKIIHCVFEYCPQTLGGFFRKFMQSRTLVPLEKIMKMM